LSAGASLLAWSSLAAVLWLAAETTALRTAESNRPLGETVIAVALGRTILVGSVPLLTAPPTESVT